MKAAYGVEAVGLTPAQERYATHIGILHWLRKQMRPWLAQLHATHPVHRYQRSFLPPKIDYTHANPRGDRGVWYWWTLTPGNIYESRHHTDWERSHRTFLTPTPDGDIEIIDQRQVDRWLNDA